MRSSLRVQGIEGDTQAYNIVRQEKSGRLSDHSPKNRCEGRDLNPWTPAGLDLKSSAVGRLGYPRASQSLSAHDKKRIARMHYGRDGIRIRGLYLAKEGHPRLRVNVQTGHSITQEIPHENQPPRILTGYLVSGLGSQSGCAFSRHIFRQTPLHNFESRRTVVS